MTADAPRVALVHDWLTGMRGGENVLETLGAMFPDAPIHTLFHIPGSVSEEIESHPIRTSFLQRAPGVKRHYRQLLALFPTAIEDFDLTPYDVVVSSSHCVAKGAIPRPGAFHLCYCFTPMRYAWDQEHVYFPRRHGLTARIRGAILSRLRQWDVTSVPRVDVFVTISRFVAARIRRYYGREAEVLPPPVDVDYFSPGEGAEGDYVLAVAALVPYKRLDLAIAASERAGVELRIVGDGPDRKRLESLGGSRTRLLGRVPKEELRELYRGARCFVQPGIEDFGIASAEALACGTPVVALGVGGVTDVVTDGETGVLYGGADSPAALARAIDRAGKIRFNELKSRRQAESFSERAFRERLESILVRRFQEGSRP